MQKNGHCNIRQAAQDKREKYMADFFTTFVDLDWLYSVGEYNLRVYGETFGHANRKLFLQGLIQFFYKEETI